MAVAMHEGDLTGRRLALAQPGRQPVEIGEINRFTIDGQPSEVGPGDAFIIPSGAEHGCTCQEEGVLIDSFTPRRDDFL